MGRYDRIKFSSHRRSIQDFSRSSNIRVTQSSSGRVMLSQLGIDGSSLTERTLTLVLLPGLDGTEVFFNHCSPRSPDGSSLSSLPIRRRAPVVMRNLLDPVLAAVEDAKDFYVLGWSFSGPLALMLAAKERSKVRDVILCASFVRPPLPGLAWLRCVVTAPVVRLVRLARTAFRIGRLLLPAVGEREIFYSQFAFRAAGAEILRSSWKYFLPL